MRSGTDDPAALVARAVDNEQTMLALTDRDTVGGAVSFVRACRSAGIGAILGADIALLTPQPYRPTPAELRRLGYSAAEIGGAEFAAGRGCAHCHYTGYEGRVGVFELLVLNEDVKNALRSRTSSTEIRRASMQSSGLVTLLEDGIAKAATGQTTIAEVLRNLPRIEKPRPVAEIRRILGA